MRKEERRGFETEGFSAIQRTVKPLSVVGTLLSYRRDDYWEGGAHPSGDIIYAVRDPRQPRHAVRLTELFPDQDVLRALLADPIVRRVLAREKKADPPPKTAAELAARLKLLVFGGEEDCDYCFPPEMLEQFAFDHLERDRVAVRICLPWGVEINRFRSSELGLLLPIPPRLRRALSLAAARKEGFLEREARRSFGDKTTEVASFGLK